jgi:hypothetical protein
MIDELQVYAGDPRMLQGIRQAIKDACGIKFDHENRAIDGHDFDFLIHAVRG